MEKNIRPVWAEINIDNIKNNIKEIKKSVEDKEVIAVVKANAYGHGAIEIAPVLLENGADRLAVAMINEAIELRENNIKASIIILGYTMIDALEEVISNDIEQTVYSLDYAKEISKIAKKLGKTAMIHIAVDTGMGRVGFLPNKESIEDVIEISKLENIKITGVFTHFSTADEEDKSYTKEQVNKFNYFVKSLEDKNINLGLKHVSNSAAIIDIEDAIYDAVRPGIILYGYYPSKEVKKDKIKILPALTLKSQIVHVKKVAKDQYISYGRQYKTNKESIIATLPIGYADGYLRALFEKGKVIVNNTLVPVVGRICMDQCMIDITDIGEVPIETEVTVIGDNGQINIDAEYYAELLNTINYEILCMIGRRVPRMYIENSKVIKTRNYL